MKKALKFFLVLLCISIFAALLLFAVNRTAKESALPKAPLYVAYKPIESIYDPMAVIVTLPENHNADEIILYFGDELGRFEGEIGRYPVTDGDVACVIPNDAICPEGTTRIWAYTANEKAESEGGYSMDLYALETLPLIDEETVKEEADAKESVRAEYVVIIIAAALSVSLIGYLLLGKKKPEEEIGADEAEDK